MEEALEHVNVHSYEAGDMYANRVQTSDTPQRFNATSSRYRTVIIGNTHISLKAYIGKYYSNASTFYQNALVIWTKSNITFEYVDLYNLAYSSYAGATYLQIIGINEY